MTHFAQLAIYQQQTAQFAVLQLTCLPQPAILCALIRTITIIMVVLAQMSVFPAIHHVPHVLDQPIQHVILAQLTIHLVAIHVLHYAFLATVFR